MGILSNDNGYAIRLSVPLLSIYGSSSQAGIATPTVMQRDQPGTNRLFMSSLPAGSSALFTWDLPPVPYQVGNTGNNVPRGFQVTDVTMAVTVSSGTVSASAGASAMSFTAWLYPSSGFQDGAVATTVATQYGGSSSQWTFNEGSSVGASFGAGLSPASTFAVIQAVPGAGLNSYINVDNQRLVFEMSFAEGATTSTMTVSINSIDIHGNWLVAP